MKKTTILIVEDHQLLRQTWAQLLNSHPPFRVVGETQTGESALDFVRIQRPDIILMDINLPGISGFEATEGLLHHDPTLKIIALSLHNDVRHLKKMLKMGAKGYLTKNATREELIRAIEEVFRGGSFLSQDMKNQLSDEFTSPPHPDPLLSRREREIIHLVREGQSSRQIAELLGLSPKTIEVHRYNIFRKLGVKNSVGLVNYLQQHPDL